MLGLTKERDRRRDVAPHQPNPYRAAVRRQGRTFLLFACLMALLMGWSAQRAASRGDVHNFSGQTVPGVTPTPEHTFLSEPFTLGKSSAAPAPLDVELFAPLQNSWLGADIANLRWGDWRPEWALLLLGIMALLPLINFLRLRLFENRRAEDN